MSLITRAISFWFIYKPLINCEPKINFTYLMLSFLRFPKTKYNFFFSCIRHRYIDEKQNLLAH